MQDLKNVNIKQDDFKEVLVSEIENVRSGNCKLKNWKGFAS